MSTLAVVGNPRPRSRTRAAAEGILERLTGAPPDRVVDVVDLGPGLLGWADPAVEDAVRALREAEVAVVASPTYKGTYTGLLKLFLDQDVGVAEEGQGLGGLPVGAGAQVLGPRVDQRQRQPGVGGHRRRVPPPRRDLHTRRHRALMVPSVQISAISPVRRPPR